MTEELQTVIEKFNDYFAERKLKGFSPAVSEYCNSEEESFQRYTFEFVHDGTSGYVDIYLFEKLPLRYAFLVRDKVGHTIDLLWPKAIDEIKAYIKELIDQYSLLWFEEFYDSHVLPE